MDSGRVVIRSCRRPRGRPGCARWNPRPGCNCVRKPGAALGRLPEPELEWRPCRAVPVAWLGSGLICLAVTTRRRSEVPGGEQVMSVSVGVGVGLSTATSVGSTILTAGNLVNVGMGVVVDRHRVAWGQLVEQYKHEFVVARLPPIV